MFCSKIGANFSDSKRTIAQRDPKISEHRGHIVVVFARGQNEGRQASEFDDIARRVSDGYPNNKPIVHP